MSATPWTPGLSTQDALAIRPYLRFLHEHGVTFDQVLPEKEPNQDGSLLPGREHRKTWTFANGQEVHEARNPIRRLGMDHAGYSVGQILETMDLRGKEFWEVGCGTGVLVALAALRGATVLASELDRDAIELARETLRLNKVEGRCLEGSLLEPFPEDAQPDVVIANLPHKPSPPGASKLLIHDGGLNGTEVHEEFLTQLLPRCKNGTQLLFFMHSLPDPKLLKGYGEHMRLTPLLWKRRFLMSEDEERGGELYRQRAREGTSFLGHQDDRPFLFGVTWRGVVSR